MSENMLKKILEILYNEGYSDGWSDEEITGRGAVEIDQAKKEIKNLMLSEEEILRVLQRGRLLDNNQTDTYDWDIDWGEEHISKAIIQAQEEKMGGRK